MSEHRLCFISRNYYDLTSAGNKAKTDNEDTLLEMGAVNLGLRRSVRNSKAAAFFLDLTGILRACCLLRRDDILFLQYPVKKYFSFLCRMAHWKGAKTLSLIHDLGSFRRRKLTIEQEIARLSHSDYIIASNENMKRWLESHGMKKPIGSLGLFDYRSEETNLTIKTKEPEERRIVYAGALSMRKNAFLVKLSQQQLDCHLIIYGNKEGLQGLADNTNISYKGFMPSEQFIRNVDADFGLVWDGDSLDTCSGNYGEYLRWNSPHKVSFYLRASLPVIVWKEAAVAPIIEQAGAGFAISSLAELGNKLKQFSQEDIARMKQQAAETAKKLNKGTFLREAIRQAMARI